MKRINVLLPLFMAAAICACSCDRAQDRKDESAVTILISSMGAESQYLHILADGVKNKYGIDIKFIDCYSSNRTRQVELELAHGHVPADMIICDKKVPENYLKPICLNLLQHSHIASKFPYATIKKCSVEEGAVYELPVASKLIGITYNATLMEENGWKAPDNFQDMLDLKRKCDAAGIPFAVSEITFTGHGFNYLFHLMGSQWISTIDGENWLDEFLTGRTDVDAFKEESAYFRKWVENGLFGQLVGRKAVQKYLSSRALFFFSSTNTLREYHGDVFKAMPWISENGSNNCYTRYDNRWVMVDGSLKSEGKQEKLRKVCQVLDYFADEDFVNAVKDLAADNYLVINDYEPGDNQLYSDYASHIRAGFTQNWYYEWFSGDVIESTGNEINSYLLNNYYGGDVPDNAIFDNFFTYEPEADFDSVFKVLEEEEEEEEEERSRNSEESILFTALEEIDFEHTAKMTAISGAMALQRKIAETNREQSEIKVALMPYINSFSDVHPWVLTGYSTARVHKGAFNKSDRNVLVPNPARLVNGIWMTGAEIKKIISSKFDPSGFFINSSGVSTFDIEHYGPYSYACAVKGGETLKDDSEYLVSVSRYSLAPDVYKRFYDSGKVLKSETDGSMISCQIADGLDLFFDKHKNLTQQDIDW